jgi:NADPH:quinone reductase
VSRSPDSMQAIRIHATGGPEALQVDRIQVPAARAGEALVRLDAAGVNYIDVYKRVGLYRIPLPATLGEEGAGTVVAVGPGAPVRAGDRVAWTSVPGAYAEYAVVPAAKLVPLPSAISTLTGAAVMLQGLTAHYLTRSTYPLKPGDRCLVHAAAGGVGLLLVQIARRAGAFVIGTAGTEEKAELARAAGAQEVIVYTRQDFSAEVRRITGGRGVQVVYDSVGKTTFLPGLDLLVPRGMMVLFGQSSGPVAPIDPQLLNQKGSLFLTRPALGHYLATREELLQRADELFAWIGAGELTVRIGAEFPLGEARAAHEALEGRRTTGKVLLRP